jgi:hypothetical protein
MPRAQLSYGLLTSQNQGGGNKKQGLPPTVGLGHFSMKVIQQRGGYCPCPLIIGGNNCALKVVNGGIFNTTAQLEKFRGCTKINGDLIITEFIGQPDFSVFDCLEEISGDFRIGFGQQGGESYISSNNALETIAGFNKLKTIGGSFYIFENNVLKTLTGFSSLTTISGYFYISSNATLETVAGFSNLTTIGGDFYIQVNATLKTLAEFPSLTTIGGGFYITSNNALKTIAGFSNLQSISGDFYIQDNAALETIAGFPSLTTISGFFYIYNNAALETLAEFPSLETIGGDFNIYGNAALETIAEFPNLQSIGGDFIIQDNAALETVAGFSSLETIGGFFNISSNNALETVAEFPNLQTISGGFYIQNNAALETVAEFPSLTTIGGDFFNIQFNAALTTIAEFPNLQSIGGNFNISNNAALSTLPEFSSLQTIGGFFYIDNNGANVVTTAPNFISTTVSGFTSLLTISGTLPNGNIAAQIAGANAAHKTQIIAATNAQIYNAVPPGKTYENTSNTFIEVDGGTFTTNAELARLYGCTKINGELSIEGFIGQPDFSVFDSLQEITGGIDIKNNPDLETITGFTNLLTLGTVVADDGDIDLNNISLNINTNPALTSISGFSSLTTIIGGFRIENNNALETIAEECFSSLQMMKQVDSGFQASFIISSNTVLEFIPEFDNLTTIDGNLSIQDNAALKTMTGFRSLQEGLEYLTISNNAALETLPEFPSLQIIMFNLEIIGNAALETVSGFTGLTEVGNLLIQNNAALETISGFTSLPIIEELFSIANNGGNLTAINNNVVTTVSGFTSLTEINGSDVVATLQGVSAAKKTQISTALDTIIQAAVGDSGYVKENVYISPV